MKYLITIMIAFSITGCAAVHYEKQPDGKITIDYTRPPWSVTDEIILELPDNSKAIIKGQNVNLDALRIVTESAVKAAAGVK